MAIVAMVLVGVVALIHIYIVLLEMVWWTTPRGQKAFGLTPEFARETKVLAGNQGLYNGFLVAGLVWGLVHPDPAVAWQIKLFFLACVAVAGLYGAATASRKILFIQTLPAVLAILALVLA
mgnify:FL=1